VLLVAAPLFALAYANGGYGLSSRTLLAVVLWLAIFIAGVLGLLTRRAPPRAAVVAGTLLAAFAGWTLLSTLWAPNPEVAFEEFNRASLYLAVFVLAVVAAGRDGARRAVGGLELAIAAVAVVALISRLFPTLFSSRGIDVFLPSAATRLSFPVGYWNGLAALLAVGVPLCLGTAVSARAMWARAAALAAIPVLASGIYLTSSRGGAAAGVLAVAVLLAATGDRWRLLATGAAAAPGTALAVVLLANRHALVDGPLGGAAARSEGRSGAVIVALCCLLTAALLVPLERLLARWPRPSATAGRAALAVVVLAVVAAVALAHPVRRFDDFRKPIPATPIAGSGFTNTHLFSDSGSGRWQFWSAAWHEFASAPLAGGGAGSYRYWWSQHASFTYTLKNAHSLYLEVLAELGIVGFVLLTGAFAAATTAGIRRVRAATGRRRTTAAALLAAAVGYLLAAGIDWVWQLPAVTIPAIAALGLLTGGVPVGDAVRARREPLLRSRIALGVAALAGVWALVCAQAIPWLGASRISDSQAAVRAGDLVAAKSAAFDAKALEPWASSPYLQLALVAEQQGDLESARRWIRNATDRDEDDWAVWYVAARIERESGHPAAARSAHARAAALNPLSPLFAS